MIASAIDIIFCLSRQESKEDSHTKVFRVGKQQNQ